MEKVVDIADVIIKQETMITKKIQWNNDLTYLIRNLSTIKDNTGEFSVRLLMVIKKLSAQKVGTDLELGSKARWVCKCIYKN